MIACVDVDYRADHAVAACVLFRDWLDAAAADEWTKRIAPVAPYEPGQFYRRELPCLLAVLTPRLDEVRTVVVDGYESSVGWPLIWSGQGAVAITQ